MEPVYNHRFASCAKTPSSLSADRMNSADGPSWQAARVLRSIMQTYASGVGAGEAALYIRAECQVVLPDRMAGQ